MRASEAYDREKDSAMLRHESLCLAFNHPEAIKEMSGIYFMSNKITHKMFTAIRRIHNRGEGITERKVLSEILGYTITTFDELDLIKQKSVFYDAVIDCFLPYVSTDLEYGKKCYRELVRRSNEFMR